MTRVEVPRKRDPRATRESIVKAAETTFVAKGFAGASMSDIAQLAGVTKSLIHHHFGSKEELWGEVRRQRWLHYRARQTEIIAEANGGEETLTAESIEAFFRFLQQNPEWVRLNSWTILEDPKLTQVIDPELIRLGIDRCSEQQARGQLRSDLDPKHILAMLISTSLHWFMARDYYDHTRLVGQGEEIDDESFLADLIKIFREGVIPR